jgi:hypothetical protein
MKQRSLSGFCALAVCALTTPAFAVTATSYSSFEGSEEPTVIYDVQSGFRNDSYDNMTGSSTFRFTLRYRSGDWWDGDRATTLTDRQRAEVKGLGAHQKNNETFDYSQNWRTSRGGNGKFWHVFQLKATNGSADMPLVVNSITSSSGAAVRYTSGTGTSYTIARSYGISVGSFMTTTTRIRTATGSTGIVQASLNGGSFSGRTNIAVYRSGSTDYRPKWGSYRGVGSNDGYGDDYVEQRSVSANKR